MPPQHGIGQGLEWHVGQGLTVLARVHQGNWEYCATGVGSITEKGSRVNMYSNSRCRGPLNTFLAGRDVQPCPPVRPQPPKTPFPPDLPTYAVYRYDPRQFKQDSI